MKIDSNNGTAALTASTASAPRAAKPVEQGNTSAQQDNVTLSSTASQIQSLESGINQASGFDAAKVEALKQAVNEGRYTVNPEAIADKLIASARELLSQQQP